MSGVVKTPPGDPDTGWKGGVSAGIEKGEVHHSHSLELPVTVTIKHNKTD